MTEIDKRDKYYNDLVERCGRFVLYGCLLTLSVLVADYFGLASVLEILLGLLEMLGIFQVPVGVAIGAVAFNSAVRGEIGNRVGKLLPERVLVPFSGMIGSAVFSSAVRDEIGNRVGSLLPERALVPFSGLIGSIKFNDEVRNAIRRRVNELLPDDGEKLRSVIREEVQSILQSSEH